MKAKARYLAGLIALASSLLLAPRADAESPQFALRGSTITAPDSPSAEFDFQSELEFAQNFLVGAKADLRVRPQTIRRQGALNGTQAVYTYEPITDVRTLEIIWKPKNFQVGLAVARPQGPGYYIRAVVSSGNQTYINSLGVADLLGGHFQKLKLQEWADQKTALQMEALKAAGSDLVGLLLYAWNGVKTFQQVEAEFKGILDDYDLFRSELDPKNPEDKLALLKLDQLAQHTVDHFSQERWKAGAAIAWWLGLDVVTYVPKLGLKVTQGLFIPIAKWVGHTRMGEVTGRWGAKVANGFGSTGKKALDPFTRAGVRIGLFSAVKRVQIATSHFRDIILKMRAARSLSRYWSSSPKFQSFVAVDKYLNCNVNESPSRYRSWLLSAFFSIPQNLTAQLIQRQGRFLEDFDQVFHDVVVSVSTSLTIGRCFSHFDREGERTMAQHWYERQFLNHMSGYLDASLTTAKLLADTDGLTDEDLEYLRERTVANFAYTLTRGPLVSTWASTNRAEMNSEYFQLLLRGDKSKIDQHLTTEFMARYLIGMASWYSYLSFREGNSRTDLVEQERIALQTLTQDLEFSIQMLKSGRRSEIPEFELNGH